MADGGYLTIYGIANLAPQTGRIPTRLRCYRSAISLRGARQQRRFRFAKSTDSNVDHSPSCR